MKSIDQIKAIGNGARLNDMHSPSHGYSAECGVYLGHLRAAEYEIKTLKGDIEHLISVYKTKRGRYDAAKGYPVISDDPDYLAGYALEHEHGEKQSGINDDLKEYF